MNETNERTKKKSNKENNFYWNTSAWNTQSIYLFMLSKLAEPTATTMVWISLHFSVEKHMQGTCREAQVLIHAYRIVFHFGIMLYVCVILIRKKKYLPNTHFTHNHSFLYDFFFIYFHTFPAISTPQLVYK